MQTHDNTRAVYRFISPRNGCGRTSVLVFNDLRPMFIGTQVELHNSSYQLTIAQMGG